jgi:hypothetical protein
MKHSRSLPSALAAFALGSTSLLAQVPTYDIVQLTGVPAPFAAEALNDAGEVAGMSGSSAFAWKDGSVKTLAFPGKTVIVRSIDANGVVMGYTLTGGANQEVFLWNSRTGAHQTFTPPNLVFPWSANDSGVVVGLDEAAHSGFAWDTAAGTFTHVAFGALPSQSVGTLGTHAISASGVAVGGEVVFVPQGGYWEERPYRWSASNGIQPLPTLPGGFGGRAVAIDADGDAAGIVRDEWNGEQPALWKSGAAEPQALGVPFGYFVAEAVAMNRRDQVLVVAPNDWFGFTRGFLWQDGEYHDLSALQPAGSSLFVWRPIAINDGGTILVQRGPGVGGFILETALMVPRAPTAKAVLPEVADPGDVIRIVGSDLGGVTQVRFTATVGGFVGVMSVDVTPVSVDPSEVVVAVPTIGAFSPPIAFPPGEVLGSITLLAGAHASGALPFGFLEATSGRWTTIGTGGSEPAGSSPRSGFRAVGGGPVGGNPTFTPMVSGAPIGQLAVLGIGFPATPPLVPLFGGTVLLDPLLPILFFASGITGEHGVAELTVPMPAQVPSVLVGFQWVTLDLGGPGVSISDLLRTQL